MDSRAGSRAFLQRIITASPVLIFRARTSDLGFEYVSPNIERILGYAPEEALGVPRWGPDHLHPDDRDRILTQLARDLEGRSPGGEMELRLRRKDGTHIWFHAVTLIEYDEAGDPVAVVGYLIDITARKRMEERLRGSEARFHRITAAAYDAIVEIDDRARITFWNPAAERLFGHSASEAVGRPLHPLIAPAEHREAFERGFETFRTTGEGPVVGKVFEITALRRDGTVFPIELSVSALRHDGSWGAMGIVRDISERKRAEEELRGNMELLRRTDEERRRLLERVLTAQEEERRSLASNLYVGPLEKMTVLVLELGVLRRRCSESAQLETITRLEDTVERAIRQLRHLNYELTPPRLEEGLAAALRLYLEETAKEPRFDYHVENHLTDEPPTDIRTILYRIAQEALNNVRKHAHADHVDVLLQPEGAGFLVRIEDDGVDSAPGEAAAAPTGAIGLTAMRERAQMAGGWCRVEGVPGAGTRVSFWLPAGGPLEAPSDQSR